MTTLTDKERHVKLSWDLIAYRLFYYYPEKVHSSWHKQLDIPDGDYDQLEREYISLCDKLNEPNTVAQGVELDFKRPSIALALSKYSKRRLK